jgi:vacuolar-type H+-ATPase subunit H
MKTAREIILTNFPANEYSEADFDRIEQCMKEYAKEALEKASGEADADLEFIDNDIRDFRHEMIEGVDYEIAVNRQSILQIKDKLD